MPLPPLTKKQLPGFIYLMDGIFEGADSENKKIKIRQAIVSCADEYLERPKVDKSVYRTTRLWELLQEKELEKKKYAIPSIDTIEIFTTYRNNGSFEFFDDFISSHAKDINEYWKKNMPLGEVVDILFPHRPRKIEVLENRIAQLEYLLEELKENKLDDFVGEVAKNRLSHVLNSEEESILKTTFEKYVEKHIKASERKMKRAALVYRFLGAFGLLFVTTPQFSDLKSYVIHSFIDENEDDIDMTDEDEDGLDDDLLDAAL